MQKQRWKTLPNAKYISAVITSVVRYPKDWRTASATARAIKIAHSFEESETTCEKLGRRREKYDAWQEISPLTPMNYSEWQAAWCAILALIAYDDCAHFLTDKPEHVRLMAELGHDAARLLYPACLVMHDE